ncbi:MAG: asparagine synthase (glutamine-hydrolyzing) [Sulfuritalea sp.]|nr:asparagine synthase (glutamine-hydrolyzing) [Sulfuritalea sp.]
MCGLVGAIRVAGNFVISEDYIVRMRDTMVHRGPDGAGTWVAEDGSVGLGHRRLSVIDLSTAAGQPMASDDGTLRLVFNGEIYNHAALRQELDALRPTAWRTDHSDTEVVLRAYETWGIDCLHKLRGMFAIALWDGANRCLWLARDRIGIKPLYWSAHHGRITFGSEIKALLADPDQPRKVDEDALVGYLAFICTPAPRTLFAGIRKVEAGTWLRIDAAGAIREQRWYEIWDHVNPGRAGREPYGQVLEALGEAVELHKASDVPVGVFLSGGVDSSANTILFNRGLHEPIRTFSIGYDREYSSYVSELSFARRVAAMVGADHHEYLLGERDLLDFLPRMIHLQDEPIADPVCVPVYFVSKLARDHGVTVCQVGEGADELFCGYPAWRHWLRLQHMMQLPMARPLASVGRRLLAAGHVGGRLQDSLGRAALGQPVFWSSAQGPTGDERRDILGEGLRRRIGDRDGWEYVAPLWTRFQERAWEPSALNWMSFVDLSIRLPELLLMRVDKMAMGVSLEARVPFLDHRLVELALSIPEATKIRHGEAKHMLKQALRGILPNDIIDRPKQGFGVPVTDWLLGGLGDRVRAELERFSRDTGIFDMAGVNRMLAGRSSVRSWYLFNFALWHRHFIEGVAEEALLSG